MWKNGREKTEMAIVERVENRVWKRARKNKIWSSLESSSQIDITNLTSDRRLVPH
jgi:hypothetical protein